MAKKESKGQMIFRLVTIQPIIVALFLFPAAWLIMVLFGAVADNYGLQTYGYMTVYFTLLLINNVSGIVFGSISRGLINGVVAIRNGNV